MGKRFYIGIMNKSNYKEIKRQTSEKELAKLLGLKKEFKKNDNSLHLRTWVSPSIIGEINLLDFDLENEAHNFFKNDNMNDIYNENNKLYRLSKDNLLELIKLYEYQIVKNYKIINKRLKRTPNPKRALNLLKAELYYKEESIKKGINKDLKNPLLLSNSWNIELDIFNLIMWTKLVDFKEQTLFVVEW